eukprot:c1106_g1_i1.p1 GENE.c1106_g1_i1~~c1106_g1_i1.p1  ORF type:complete len:492 (+),score=85.38 c1106_g1_i1:108-1583(+)
MIFSKLTSTPTLRLASQGLAFRLSKRVGNSVRHSSQLASLAESDVVEPTESAPLRAKTSSRVVSDESDSVSGNWFIIEQILMGSLSIHRIETAVNDPVRSIELRRAAMQALNTPVPSTLPVHGSSFDHATFFQSVSGANCESVIGFMPIPVGIVGPLILDGKPIQIPMATTEGALIASANRGARALSMSGGITSVVTRDAMSRAPVVKASSILQAAEIKRWVESDEGLEEMQQIFNTTSRFGRLLKATAAIAGRNVFIRFSCSTGDAMGMNMVTKGINTVIENVVSRFENVEMVTLSGNMCMDKKPSAINWIEGRGKSVSAEAVIPAHIVKDVLKADVHRMVEVNKTKNLIGSALAGSIGGNNAHAANLVAAVFLATGQDAAQVVESATCMTTMDVIEQDGQPALLMTVNMPSIEVGTVGGGTSLGPQSACLEFLGIKGSAENPGDNARTLARVVCAGVMAGELSLLAALSSNHLVSAHMALNRKPAQTQK